MTQAIIDITRAYSGSERKIVEKILEQDGSGFVTKPIVMGLDEQKSTLAGLAGGLVEWRSAGHWAAEHEVNRQIAELAKSIPHVRLKVYSFHPTIVSRLGDLAVLDGRVETISLRSYVKNSAAVGTEWPHALMPIEEALRILVEALEEARATPDNPVAKTDIRQLLARRDQRLAKTSSSLAAMPGLVSILLDKAVAASLVYLTGIDPRVRVHLSPKSAPQTRTTLTPREGMLIAPSVSSDGHSAAVAVPSTTEEEGRSKMFQTILRQSDFGIFPEVRAEFYEQIQLIADENAGTPITARELTRQAATEVRTKAPAVFEGRKRGDLSKEKYPWRKLEEFGMRAMARAGLLQGQDGKIASDVPPLLPKCLIVGPLPTDLGVRLDAELILEIFRRCPNVGWNDRVELAGAIMNGRSEARIDQVEEIIGFLLEAGKAEWDPEAEVFKAKVSYPVQPIQAPAPADSAPGHNNAYQSSPVFGT